jgi:hypothetical protein
MQCTSICVQQILAVDDWAMQLIIAYNRVLGMPSIRACILPLAEQCAYGGYVEGAARRSCSLTSTKASTTTLCTHHSPLTVPFYPDEIRRAKPGQLGSGPARYASTAGEETRRASLFMRRPRTHFQHTTVLNSISHTNTRVITDPAASLLRL